MNTPSPPPDTDTCLGLLRDMLLIRRFEEKCAELYGAQKIRGFLHLYNGEEAVAVGVLRALRSDDAFFGTYREHGHALIKGLSVRSVMAEMFGRATGCCKGRGGSMHLFSAEHRFYGGSAIVGGALPMAVGMGLADRMQGRDRITACFFGDGAVAEGEFHEAMNLAVLWKTPVLFICENNLYGMGTALNRAQSQTDLSAKAGSYKMEAWTEDGMDILSMMETARQAVDFVRTRKMPLFVECRTYRFRAHSMFDPELYRTRDEVEKWKKRDPIAGLTSTLRDQNRITDQDRQRIEEEIAREIEDGVHFAEQSSCEPFQDMCTDACTMEGIA